VEMRVSLSNIRAEFRLHEREKPSSGLRTDRSRLLTFAAEQTVR